MALLRARIEALETKLNRLETNRGRAKASSRSLLVERLPDPSARILIWEAVQQEAADAAHRIKSDPSMTMGMPFSAAELLRRLDAYEAHLGSLLSSIVLGAAWGTDAHTRVWSKAIERVANAQTDQDGLVVWLRLRRWPALYLMYAGGVSALAHDNWLSFRSLVQDPQVRESQGTLAAAVALDPTSVLDPDVAQSLDGYERRYTPISDLLHERIRAVTSGDIPDDPEFDRIFDQFEMMFGLVYLDASDDSWAPLGRFVWRRRHYPSGDPLERMALEAEKQGASWGPLRAGLFDGSPDRFAAILGSYRALIQRRGSSWF